MAWKLKLLSGVKNPTFLANYPRKYRHPLPIPSPFVLEFRLINRVSTANRRRPKSRKFPEVPFPGKAGVADDLIETWLSTWSAFPVLSMVLEIFCVDNPRGCFLLLRRVATLFDYPFSTRTVWESDSGGSCCWSLGWEDV